MIKQIFKIGRPVTGKELIGREKEVNELLSRAMGGQSMILVAPRRYGKTSILFEVAHRLKNQGFNVGYVDIFESVGLEELAQRIVESLLENERLPIRKFFNVLRKDLRKAVSGIEFKSVIKEYEFVLSFATPQIDRIRLFDESLDFIGRYGEKKGNLVFMIDEFSDIVKWNKELLKKMRAKFQRHTNVTYLFAGSKESLMRDIFTKKSYAFYGFGIPMELRALPEEEFVSYLLSRFSRAGIGITDELASYIVQKTASHPYYTKLLAQTVADIMEPGEEAKIEIVNKAYEIALLRIKGELDKEWESLIGAPLQRKILKIIGIYKESPYATRLLSEREKRQVYFALTDLERKGIIYKVSKGKYNFCNPFFGAYLEILSGK